MRRKIDKIYNALIITSIISLGGCAGLGSLSTILPTPDTGITAQVGKTNNKQLLGGTVSNETQQRDVEGDVDNVNIRNGVNIKKADVVNTPTSSIPIGNVTADKVIVNNGSVWPVAVISLIGCVFVLLFAYIVVKGVLKRRTE